MENFPKPLKFNPPDGYFDDLADKIMDRQKVKHKTSWYRYAAAAALIVSLGVWQLSNKDQIQLSLSLEEEVNLYIDSNEWTAEDVLSMSDDPNAILDEILAEEFPLGDMGIDEITWF